MRSEIKRLQRELGVTTVLVTHDQIEATTMADRIICMSKGRIEQIGTADDLYARPNSIFVASFVGAPPINLVEGRAGGGRLSVGHLASRPAGSRRARWWSASGRRRSAWRPAKAPRCPPSSSRWAAKRFTAVESGWGELRVLDAGSTRRFALGDQVSLAIDEADILRVRQGRRAGYSTGCSRALPPEPPAPGQA